jgi:hypothetical protein
MTRNAEHMHLPLIERLTEQLKDSGTPAFIARGMALSILRDRGHVHPNSETLTAEGAKRDQMGAAGRAIDRAVKASGGRATDYTYDMRTNRAVRKKRP